ncbi:MULTISPECIES: hypothetical protein [unclassified Streptomyces]|uniref:hypothetical protein n=1 Tax=unclassified Streptomyces TaxID=2593676 RepID=UPI000B812B75|nr:MULTISPECIES: hypothetical protein [unclassified Streptomyces]
MIDGAQTTEPGGIGGGLGHSFTKDGSGSIASPGVAAGYVGIGFDNFGDFAREYSGTGGGSTRQPNTVGVRGSGSLREGFRRLTGIEVPEGFRGSWDDGSHIQVSLIDGRLTVRHASKANPNGTLLIDDFDLVGSDGQTRMPETFKLGFAAGTGAATASHRIRNLAAALPVNMPLEMSGPQTAKAGNGSPTASACRTSAPTTPPTLWWRALSRPS